MIKLPAGVTITQLQRWESEWKTAGKPGTLYDYYQMKINITVQSENVKQGLSGIFGKEHIDNIFRGEK
jgi:hypothetical protein